MFTDMIGKIWRKCLSKKNVMSGFRATGVFPPNRTKFPQDSFDAILLRYNNWDLRGSPEEELDELIIAVETPKKMKALNDPPELVVEHSSDISFDMTLVQASSSALSFLESSIA